MVCKINKKNFPEYYSQPAKHSEGKKPKEKTMWNEPQKVTPKPRYQNTVVCPYCHAEYNPTVEWVYGFYKDGTADNFVTCGEIPQGVCPWCRKKR